MLQVPCTIPLIVLRQEALYDYTKSTKWQEAAQQQPSQDDWFECFYFSASKYSKWLSKNVFSPNAELIFGRPYSPEYATAPGDFNTLPDKAQSPNSSNSWGLSNPNHTFVQDFKMANGKRISETGSGYDATKMYEGREMRFYANINFHGTVFRGKALDYSSPGGGDSKVAPGQVHFAATGYNSRKFLDESLDRCAAICQKALSFGKVFRNIFELCRGTV